MVRFPEMRDTILYRDDTFAPAMHGNSHLIDRKFTLPEELLNIQLKMT